MPQNTLPTPGPLEAATSTPVDAVPETLKTLTRPEVIANTGAELGNLAVEVGRVALPIAGIAYLTVAGIKTLFGKPPNWVRSLTGQQKNIG